MTDNLRSQLHRLRCEATDLAHEQGSPAWLSVLHEINRFQVLVDHPQRVQERGTVYPHRYSHD